MSDMKISPITYLWHYLSYINCHKPWVQMVRIICILRHIVLNDTFWKHKICGRNEHSLALLNRRLRILQSTNFAFRYHPLRHWHWLLANVKADPHVVPHFRRAKSMIPWAALPRFLWEKTINKFDLLRNAKILVRSDVQRVIWISKTQLAEGLSANQNFRFILFALLCNYFIRGLLLLKQWILFISIS